MADDNAVMDSQDRAEAALAAFTGETEEHDPAAVSEAAERAESSQQEATEQAEGEQEQQAAEGQLTEEQRNADPVFKELNEFKTAVAEVFDKHGLTAAAEANGRTAQEEADLQLSDAGLLYGIMRGETTPSQLLDTMANVGNWQQGQRDAVAGDLINWLTKAGYIKDGQAAGGEKKPAGKAGDPGFKDPHEERLSKLEKGIEDGRRAEQERVQRVEKERVGKVFVDHVAKLCKDTGIAAEDASFYTSQVAALVNGNPAITGRVAQNNFVDIKKFFDTVHNRELARLDRFNKAQLAKQQQKQRNPKITAGGGPAAPTGQAKRPVANRDDRIAAATGLLQGN